MSKVKRSSITTPAISSPRYIDLGLMRDLASGSAPAFEQLYARHVSAVRAFLVSRNGHGLPIDDMTQEVFLRVWKGARSFRGESSAGTFVLAIARNVLLEHLAKSSREQGQAHTLGPAQDQCPCNCHGCALPAGPETAQCRADLADRLMRRLQTLPGHLRQVVDLAVVKGAPVPQASATIGCSADAFRKRLARAIQSLKDVSES